MTFRKASHQLLNETASTRAVRKRKHIKHLRFFYSLCIKAPISHCRVDGIHRIFNRLKPDLFLCGKVLHHNLLETGFIKLDVSVEDADD